MRVAYFTAGTVGAGHLARGVAIERAFDRAGVGVDYRIFSAPLPFSIAHRQSVCTIPIAEAELGDPRRAPESALARAIASFSPDVLLIDLFWAPVHHLLPIARCEAWLLLRSHPARWLIGPESVPFDRSRFDRIFSIEPQVRVDFAEALCPIVIANRDELRPRADLRRALDVDDEAHLTLVVHAGQTGEIDALVARARAIDRTTTVRVANLYDEASIFPLATFFDGADRIVGGAGYNLFWETRALGLRARSALFPFARTIDDQARRLRECDAHDPLENGADRLAALISGGRSPTT